MDSRKTDYINIILMLGAAILAFNLPFELFLFSYAILGPLHYLTEIGWLHQRNYFATGKRDYYILIFLGLLITTHLFLNQPAENQIFKFIFPENPELIKTLAKLFSEWSAAFVFLAFVASIAITFLSKTIHKIIVIAIGLVLAILLKEVQYYILIFAVLFPTVIHVWFFTGIFILAGALKSKQFSGHLSLIVFIFCSISFFVIRGANLNYQISDYVQKSFTQSNFQSVSTSMFNILFSTKKIFFLNSPKGLMIQRFIAFAYTYHYLNWFSKTNVIRWHDVPKKWLYTCIGLWLCSIALYIYDYKTGFLALFFLSMMHVFLEFPLNCKSIIQIKDVLFVKRKPGLAGR
jgi:hypothetical protein